MVDYGNWDTWAVIVTVFSPLLYIAIAYAGWRKAYGDGMRLQYKAIELSLMNDVRQEVISALIAFTQWTISASALSHQSMVNQPVLQPKDEKELLAAQNYQRLMEGAYNDLRPMMDLPQQLLEYRPVLPALSRHAPPIADTIKQVNDAWGTVISGQNALRDGQITWEQYVAAAAPASETMRSACVILEMARRDIQRGTLNHLLRLSRPKEKKPT